MTTDRARLLQGKNAFITGTNRGIGRAVLVEYARHGASVWAHARGETPEFLELLSHLSGRHGVEIRPLCFDLTDSAAMKAAVKEVMASRKPVDVLVNNAGITYNALFHMSTEARLREQFDVNFFSVFLLTQYLSKLMVRQGSGSIVNIASTAGLDANPGRSVYGASKAAVICMSKAIAAELGSSGVRSNCIAPGVTRTDMLGSMSQDVVQESIDKTDLKRCAEPEDIARVAVFLGSDRSSYLTGQVLRADGGLMR